MALRGGSDQTAGNCSVEVRGAFRFVSRQVELDRPSVDRDPIPSKSLEHLRYGDRSRGVYRFQREGSKLCADPQHHNVLRIRGPEGRRTALVVTKGSTQEKEAVD